MYIYIDETQIHRRNNEEVDKSGLGMLLVKDNYICEEIINNSKITLAACNDISNDIKNIILKRGYFHANEDRLEVKKIVFNEINKKIDFLRFDYSFENGQLKDVYKKMLKLIVCKCSQYRDEINVKIEKNSIVKQNSINHIIETTYEELEQLSSVVYSSFMIPKFYCNYKIEVVRKNEYGNQICDYLLWYIHRERTKPEYLIKNNIYLERKININTTSENLDQGNFCGSRILFQNSFIDDKYEYPLGSYPNDNNLYDKVEIINSWFIIENFVNYFIRESSKNSEIEHIYLRYKELENILLDENVFFTSEIVEKMSSFFIRIFDTLPIYNEENKKDIGFFKIILKAKNLAGIILNKNLIINYGGIILNSNIIIDFIIKIRTHYHNEFLKEYNMKKFNNSMNNSIEILNTKQNNEITLPE